ncbi:MAG: hypothetical protein ACLFVW_07460 [Phycisphaerae bacterium]
MSSIEVICPSCGAALKVPDDSMGKKGRCAVCKAVFKIADVVGEPATPEILSEDSILGWLAIPDEEIDRAAREAEKQKQTRSAQRPASPDSLADKPAEPTAVEPSESTADKPDKQETENAPDEPGSERQSQGSQDLRSAATTEEQPPEQAEDSGKELPIRMDHVDTMGAFFLFDSELLYDEDFRASFPQRCILCGTPRALSVYLVVWSSKLTDRAKKDRSLQKRAPAVRKLDELGGLAGKDLLKVLGRVEHMPEPYCLPFPYYVCQSCSPLGAVVTDVHTTADGMKEICELGISSVPQAEQFIRHVAGTDSEVYRQLREVRQKAHGDAWLMLPLGVRNRIKQWFDQGEDERFVAYIPDADFVKAEAGTGGLVLTDQRLVYHKALANVEFPLTDDVHLEPKEKGSRLLIEISSPNAPRTVRLAAQPTYLDQLRSLLSRYSRRAKKAAGKE